MSAIQPNFNILSSSLFYKHPYFDSTYWFYNANIALGGWDEIGDKNLLCERYIFDCCWQLARQEKGCASWANKLQLYQIWITLHCKEQDSARFDFMWGGGGVGNSSVWGALFLCSSIEIWTNQYIWLSVYMRCILDTSRWTNKQMCQQ